MEFRAVQVGENMAVLGGGASRGCRSAAARGVSSAVVGGAHSG